MRSLQPCPAPQVVAAQPAKTDPLWYTHGVIYQLHVRSFYDSDGDGIGDFAGIIEKLGYIQSLGVSAIWLLPFFPSPLKDDGYDIADYTSVNSSYGTLEDFQRFLGEAHARNLRVITELVLNHTSDQHRWFQRSRKAAPGGKWRNYYVWSDTPDRYREARVIFQDFETSNWTWDSVAGAYYWHRFYHHQPDLNFDNPEVHRAMLDAIDFWFELGVDGVRLDAVPYLYEREGTNCENLPETHAFLVKLRKHVDEKFSGRMLLAEANQWPEDAVAYFGAGDECHMNFNFPLMPRLFMAVQREDRFAVIDILEQTPPVPQGCQWGIFLRNHDELTLEMVTDEERHYMYEAYASDPQARINLGIRHRLAPLLKNDRRKIELLNGLLLSLPGTPIVYYGDEIGMGDNIYLGDRNGVRTPMQWNADRNAGFSHSNPQRLFLPVIIDPAYHYSTLNVEVEENNRHSLLWWMKRIVYLRNQFDAFGKGSFRLLASDNVKVLAYLRQYNDETLLVVANLSRHPQCAELDLSEFRGQIPTELFGDTPFPPIGELPYFFTLGSHGFFWFALGWPRVEMSAGAVAEPPLCAVDKSWNEYLHEGGRDVLERALRAFLERDRWFFPNAGSIRSLELRDAIPVGGSAVERDQCNYWLLLARIASTAGVRLDYAIPAVLSGSARAANILGDHPHAGILTVAHASAGERRILREASWEHEFWQLLLARMKTSPPDAHRNDRTAVARNNVAWEHFSGIARHERSGDSSAPGDDSSADSELSAGVKLAVSEHRYPTAILGNKYELKLYRHLGRGANSDVEISFALSQSPADVPIPKLLAAWEYTGSKTERLALASLSEWRPRAGDVWSFTLDELGRALENADRDTIDVDWRPNFADIRSLLAREAPDAAPMTALLFGDYLRLMRQLGARLGDLHRALAEESANPRMAREPLGKLYLRSLYQSIRSQVRRTSALLWRRRGDVSMRLHKHVERFLAAEETILGNLKSVLDRPLAGVRLRCHANFDLRSVLYDAHEISFIDFEGRPGLEINERPMKASPLRDLAGAMGSLYRAGQYAMLKNPLGSFPAAAETSAERLIDRWFAASAGDLLQSYFRAVEGNKLIPETSQEAAELLQAHLLELACLNAREELERNSDLVEPSLRALALFAGSAENANDSIEGEA